MSKKYLNLTPEGNQANNKDGKADPQFDNFLSNLKGALGGNTSQSKSKFSGLKRWRNKLSPMWLFIPVAGLFFMQEKLHRSEVAELKKSVFRKTLLVAELKTNLSEVKNIASANLCVEEDPTFAIDSSEDVATLNDTDNYDFTENATSNIATQQSNKLASAKVTPVVQIQPIALELKTIESISSTTTATPTLDWSSVGASAKENESEILKAVNEVIEENEIQVTENTIVPLAEIKKINVLSIQPKRDHKPILAFN